MGPALSFDAAEGTLTEADTVTTTSVAAGQCVALRVELFGTTTATYLSCTLERLPG
ncbi:hypothetical protein K2Z84_34235 [Candidatus Binatia bacterium]|nr:hypothetical protein [Candidatus Binatia bacterium]